jgi:hypothetical protein
MTLDDAARRLMLLLRQENDLLAAGDPAGAARLLPQKQDAVAALQSALPGAVADAAVAAELREVTARNRALLTGAMQVQSRILAMVARAARAAAPGATTYAPTGAATQPRRAMALTLRA